MSIPLEKGFHFKDGRAAQSLQDFINAIYSANNETLEYHFHGGHFEPWLRDILGECEWASNMELLRKGSPNLTGEGLRQAIFNLLGAASCPKCGSMLVATKSWDTKPIGGVKMHINIFACNRCGHRFASRQPIAKYH